VNSAVVVGNLTSDPRINGGDNKVVNFRMGVNHRRRPENDSAGEVKDRTEFIDVECWGSQAENINASLRRGNRVIVSGRLKYDQWTDDTGNFRSRVSINAAAVGLSLEFQPVNV